ncbi:MAG: DUF2207 domain-containing protein [Gammaproteobacteria bacterium]|nr:DUF2207 domain-containing protein [Gammaproteobacteria bacterium]
MRWLAASLLLIWAPWTNADERILSFHSDVHVFTNGMIEVIETVRVRSEGKQIRRGIYRDIPVEYEDRLGNNYNITVEVLSALRNDRPEAFRTVRSGRDVRVYFGRSDHFIEKSEHTYVYRYRVNRMLGFFDENDELYWNVTGNRWAFPVDKASATVTLFFDAPRDAILVDGYTGRYGSSAQDYSVRLDEAGAVHFQANQSLPAAHGLTVVVGWPKGLVDEPTRAQRIGWLLKDNRNLLIAVVGLLLLLAYYIPVWRKFGKDPDEGVVMTRYIPPRDFSPASLRYIRQMYYDDKVMTAAVVNLAVKGFLEISDNEDTHVLKKLDADGARPELAAGERELYEALFSEGSSVTLEDSNHALLGGARGAHKESLKDDYKQKYFRTNGAMNIPAVAIVLLSTVMALSAGNGPTALVIATVVMMFVTMIFFAIVMKRPTMRGRQVLDEMLGFKDYLEIAEKEELNLRNPPDKTPQLFEAYLPFALALGVDQQWSEKFASVLAAIRGPDGDAYSPSWYNGNWNSSNLTKATSGLSNGLGNAISTSVTPPGSSSGGGGGGFSGGGGGGGGGGGW